MFSSFVKQMVFKDEEDAKKYKACHLRRQAIVHFCAITVNKSTRTGSSKM